MLNCYIKLIYRDTWQSFLLPSLQTVPDHIIRNRALRTGDGTHHYSIEAAEKKKMEEMNNNVLKKSDDVDESLPAENYWGFGDKDMSSKDMKFVKVIDKSHEHVSWMKLLVEVKLFDQTK